MTVNIISHEKFLSTSSRYMMVGAAAEMVEIFTVWVVIYQLYFKQYTSRGLSWKSYFSLGLSKILELTLLFVGFMPHKFFWNTLVSSVITMVSAFYIVFFIWKESSLKLIVYDEKQKEKYEYHDIFFVGAPIVKTVFIGYYYGYEQVLLLFYGHIQILELLTAFFQTYMVYDFVETNSGTIQHFTAPYVLSHWIFRTLKMISLFLWVSWDMSYFYMVLLQQVTQVCFLISFLYYYHKLLEQIQSFYKKDKVVVKKGEETIVQQASKHE